MKHVIALFELDTRSLALFRVLLGATLVADLLFRASDIPTFYTDNGVLPRAPLVGQYIDPFHVSFHLASGAASVQYALFAVALLCALAFIFGFRTRLATFLSWLLLLSLHNRNFMVLSGSDQLLRLLLFWAMFLPVGASYSLDRALVNARRPRADDRPTPTSGRTFVSVGSAAFILQICCVYLFSAVLKSDPAWWREGSALYYALSIDYLTTPLAKMLLQFPSVVRVLSWLSIALEAAAPALLFVPRVQPRLRTLVVLVFMLFHLGMLPFLTLGTFPFVSVAAWAALLPTRFWEKRLAHARRRAGTTTIYYDGDCGFCRRALEVVRTFLAIGETRVVRAQDEAEIDAEMRRLNSWIIVTESGERKSKFDAFVHLCRLSPVARVFAPLLAWRPVMRLGTRIYEWVARSRAGLGRPAARLRPERPFLRATVISNLVAAVLLAYVLAWNVGTITDYRWGVPESARWFGVLFRLDQQWGMFAPFPRKSDGWLVIPGTLAGGAEVDLFRDGAPVSWEKPARVSALFANAYRQKYMENLLDARLSGVLLLYGQHLCRAWNAEHSGGETLNSFEINYVEELTPPPGEPTAAPRRISVWKHNCF